MLFGNLSQTFMQTGNLRVNIETIHRVNPHSQYFRGIRLHTTGWGTQNCHVYILDLSNIRHDNIVLQFGRHVRRIPAYYSCYFKVGSSLQCLKHVTTYISIPDDGCSNFLHLFLLFKLTSQITK